ncbi:MAG: hypothetical protein QOG57_6655 [Pseudonocardiales bacterium]|jgi:hypothetical protein|nr:hypothetical protein [Pseudonocardiales bacterium]
MRNISHGPQWWAAYEPGPSFDGIIGRGVCGWGELSQCLVLAFAQGRGQGEAPTRDSGKALALLVRQPAGG